MKRISLKALAALLVMFLGLSSGAEAMQNPSKQEPKKSLRILVKLKPTFTKTVEPNLSRADLTVTSNDAVVGPFLRKHHSRGMRPLYRDLVREKKKTKKSENQIVSELRGRFGRRNGRAVKKVSAPALSDSYILDYPNEKDLEAGLKSLQADANVQKAERERGYTIQLTPDDPYYNDQWGAKKIAAASAWDVSTGSGIVVAVVDTGIDYNHRDLSANVWTDPSDGTHGFDFANNDNDPLDDHGHGTHVAGTIAATGNNHLGVIGVAWNAKVMAVKALDAQGTGFTSDLALAIHYAADHGADVINMSFGGPGEDPVLDDALQYAYSQGVVLVAAAGNSNVAAESFSPANSPYVITVSALDSNDQKANFSNYGSKIDVGAPGVDILSLRAAGTSIGTVTGRYYTRLSGTSMAAPHASGLAALILSQKPASTPEQVRAILRASAEDVGPVGPDPDSGAGRINAQKALQSDGTSTVNRAPLVSAGAAQTVLPKVPVLLKGAASDDGLPNPPAKLTYAWTQIDGPGTVSFANPASLSTNATFSSSGTYTLRLSASDGELTSNDTVTITAASDSHTLSGQITVRVIDFIGGKSKTQYFIGSTEIFFAPGTDTSNLLTGMSVTASGQWSGVQFNASQVTITGGSALLDPRHHHNIVFLVLRFQDDNPVIDMPTAQSQANDVAAYYNASFGGLLTTSVYGIYTLPINRTSDLGSISSRANAVAAANGVPLGKFDGYVYMIDYNEPTQGGIADIGGSKAWIRTPSTIQPSVHELGHCFGLQHSNALQCTSPSSCVEIEYGDHYDPMGSNYQSFTYHFNAYQKEKLTWLTSIPVKGYGTYHLDPLEKPWLAGPFAIKFTSAFLEVLYFEYRTQGNGTTLIPGLYVHSNRGQSNGGHEGGSTSPTSLLLGAVPEGTYFNDVARNIRAIAIPDGNGGATLQLTPAETVFEDAYLVTNGIPSVLTVGNFLVTSIGMMNNGTTNWAPDDGYSLKIMNVSDTQLWGIDHSDLRPGEMISAGQTEYFPIALKAPKTAGDYTLDFQMTHNGVPFGRLTTVPVTVVDLPPHDARFYWQSVPSVMTAGQTYSVSVAMKNIGAMTWTAADAFKLGSQNPQDNSTWGFNRVDLGPNDSIASGQVKYFSFNVTAPVTPGTYDFQWEMLQEAVTWFGDLSPSVAVSVVAPPPLDAKFVGWDVPWYMTAGQTYPVSVTMQNTGASDWTEATAFHLGSQNPQDNGNWGIGRVYLAPGETISTGQTKTFSFNVTAPATGGTYNFQWQMVQDGVAWFGDITATIPVTVQAPPPTAYSQTIPVAFNTAQSVTLTGSDPFGLPLEYIVITLPTYGTLSGSEQFLTYTPPLNYSGPDSFSFEVYNGSLVSTPATVSLTVDPPTDPTATAQNVKTAFNANFGILLTGTDPGGLPLTYTVVANPAHGTLSGTAPGLTYAPTNGYTGPDSFSFKVNNGFVDSLPATVNVYVSPPSEPTAIAQSVTTAFNTAKSIALTGTDSNNLPLTYTVTVVPIHGTLSGIAPNVTYTPTSGYSGPDNFSFKVNNGFVDSASAAVNIMVSLPGAPTANSQSIIAIFNTAKAVFLTGTDPNGLTLTYTITVNPTHGTLSGTAPNLTYTSAFNYSGPDSLSFKVNNGSVDSTPATVSITVGLPAVPTANAQGVSMAFNTAIPITLTGTDPNALSLSYTITANPTHGTLSGTIPNLTYTPALNYTGSDSFTFKVNNGSVDSAPATVSITVSPPAAPIANAQNFTTPFNTNYGIPLTGTDPNGLPLTFTVTANPTHGTLLDSVPGLTYAPTRGYAGPDSFSFKVNNGIVDSVAATISITVSPPMGLTAATSQSVTTAFNTAKSITLTGTDSNSLPLTYSITVNPIHGTLSGTAPNVTYTPTSGYAGPDNFSFKVNNGFVDSNVASVSITVQATTLPPPSLPDFTFNLPSELSVKGLLSLNVPAGYPAAHFDWTFTWLAVGPSAGSPRAALAAGSTSSQVISTRGPEVSLASQPLSPGYYLVTVQAFDSSGRSSAKVQANTTFVSDDSSAVRVFPNPWKATLHRSKDVTFDTLGPGAVVKIFALTGDHVRTLTAVNGQAFWNLRNDQSDLVTSGIYIYLITDTQGSKTRGKLVIIR